MLHNLATLPYLTSDINNQYKRCQAYPEQAQYLGSNADEKLLAVDDLQILVLSVIDVRHIFVINCYSTTNLRASASVVQATTAFSKERGLGLDSRQSPQRGQVLASIVQIL